MFKIAKVLSLMVETPLHAGSGNDLGIVDLPIQRERHTGYPKIEASGLKGSLREIFEAQKANLPEALTQEFPITSANYKSDGIDLTFGPDEGDLHAGALGFTDVRLLLFPVKSMKGVFAWITCPAVLERFASDLRLTKQTLPDELGSIKEIQAELQQPDIEGIVPSGSNLIIKDGRLILEEYTFISTASENGSRLATWLADNLLPGGDEYTFWREKMKTDIVILSDNDFRDFVTLSTEVIARTKIDHETGTVDKKIGGLWYEEYLPADSLIYALVLASPVFKTGSHILSDETKVMAFFEKGLPEIMQIGGNATLGKGLVRTKLLSNSDNEGGQRNGNE